MDGLIAAARILASFVLGSIPFAKVAMIGTGIDITKAGSKNPGFNNVLRVCREAGIASKNLRGAFALAFLFAGDSVEFDDDAVAKVLTPESRPVLDAARAALGELDDWTTESIEAALRAALVDGLGLKPKLAFGPVRVAITGRRVSPPLFESLELLGRDQSLARLDAAADRVAA